MPALPLRHTLSLAITAMALLLPLRAACSGAAPTLEDDVARCLQLRRSEPRAAVTLAESLLRREGLAIEAQIKSLSCLGIAAGLIGEGERAASAARRILEEVNRHPGLPQEFVLRAVSNAGAIFHSVGQVHRAEVAYTRANVIASTAGGEDAAITQAVHLTNIGLIHADYLDSPVVADRYYRQALAMAATVSHEDPQLLYNHAVNLITLDRRDEAREVLQRAETLAARDDNHLIAQRVRAERAGLLIGEGKPGQARTLLAEALRVQPSLPDPAGEASSLAKMSALQRAAGDPAGALRTAERAWAIVEAGYHHRKKIEVLGARFAAHVAMGDMTSALQVSQALHALKMDALKRQRLELLADLQARSQDAVAERELQKLQHDQQIQALRADKAALMRNAVIAVLALLILAGGVGAVMQRQRNRHLRRISAVDALTGLKNRRTATRELNALVRRMRHDDGTRHVLFLIDVDHFKQINDTWGHHAGDAVLVELSRRLQSACRPGDLVSRWGGEEFLVACPDLRLLQAEQIAERLRAAMAYCLDGHGIAWPVSASVGMAPIPFFDRPPEGQVSRRWDYALRLADRALYSAKARRNAWVGYWCPRLSDDATAEAVIEQPEAARHLIQVVPQASDARADVAVEDACPVVA